MCPILSSRKFPFRINSWEIIRDANQRHMHRVFNYHFIFSIKNKNKLSIQKSGHGKHTLIYPTPMDYNAVIEYL